MAPPGAAPEAKPAAPEAKEADAKKAKEAEPAKETPEEAVERLKVEAEKRIDNAKTILEDMAKRMGKPIDATTPEAKKAAYEGKKPERQDKRERLVSEMKPLEEDLAAKQKALQEYVEKNTPKQQPQKNPRQRSQSKTETQPLSETTNPEYRGLVTALREAQQKVSDKKAEIKTINDEETAERRALRPPPRTSAEAWTREMKDAAEDMKSADGAMDKFAAAMRVLMALMALIQKQEHGAIQEGRDAVAGKAKRKTIETEISGAPVGATNRAETYLATKKTEQTTAETNLNNKNTAITAKQNDINTAQTNFNTEQAKPPPPNAAEVTRLTNVLQAAKTDMTNLMTEKANFEKEVAEKKAKVEEVTKMIDDVKTGVATANTYLNQAKAQAKIPALGSVSVVVGPDGLSPAWKIDPPADATALNNLVNPKTITLVAATGIVTNPDVLKEAITAAVEGRKGEIKEGVAVLKAAKPDGEWFQKGPDDTALQGDPYRYMKLDGKALQMQQNATSWDVTKVYQDGVWESIRPLSKITLANIPELQQLEEAVDKGGIKGKYVDLTLAQGRDPGKEYSVDPSSWTLLRRDKANNTNQEKFVAAPPEWKVVA
ncbi:MAG: hypothetical protein V1926_00205 [Candidatus Peregrinibacteria bacterium]